MKKADQNLYQAYSHNRLNQAQAQRIAEMRQAQLQLQEQAKHLPRYRSPRKIMTTIAVVCLFLALVGLPVLLLISNLLAPTNQANTPAAFQIPPPHTPLPTTTLQVSTFQQSATPDPAALVNTNGQVYAPAGFWSTPGMLDAYKQGTPVAYLVENNLAPVDDQHIVSYPTPQPTATVNPAIAAKVDELELAQIEAQIEIVNAQAEAAQQIAQAEAAQEIAKNQAATERTISYVNLFISGVFWLLVGGTCIVLLRLVIIPLFEWFVGGLVDEVGNLLNRFRFWAGELRQPVTQAETTKNEIAEHIRSLPINSHQSQRRLELERQLRAKAQLAEQQIIDVILATWDDTENLTECQRRAFGQDQNGNWRTGGAFYHQAKQIVDKYRPGHDTPTPPGRIEPYLGNTTP